MTEEPVTAIPALDPGERLLCGPGPSNVHPKVLEATRLPMHGHLDPDFWDLLLDLAYGLRALWRRPDGLSLCFSASGTSGMEAGVASLVEPGDTVIVVQAGFFGARIAEMVRRYQADLIELTAPLERIVPVDEVLEALATHPDAKLVAVVHAETSTGVRYPVPELGHAMRAAGSEALLLADFVTSLGGEEVSPADWGVD
jgi:alanine-glyoxylate transaminase / serine-glyoxylate transaminase / serine-pyruvate transaminase